MNDQAKTNAELLKEISVLTKKIKKLEKAKTTDKRAEEVLKQSEEKYRLVVENAREAIIITQDVKLVFVNHAVIGMIGYSKEILTSKYFTDFIHPDDLNMVVDHHIKRIKGEEVPPVYPFRVIAQNGTVIWCELNAAVIQWKERPATLNFLNDITERKRAEEKVNQLAAIVQSSEDAIIAEDMDGIITSWNRGAEKLYGFTESEVIGKSISLLIPSGNRDEVPAILDRIKSGENIEHYETVRRRKDGREIQISLKISPILNSEGKVIGASTIGRDITKRTQMEEALRDSEKIFRELSIVDELTQLFNSRHFYFQLQIELDRSNRYGQPLTLFLLDLDNFKAFNDTYGHVEGDQVLRRLGQVLKRCIRKTDLVYRYGGEEFTILLLMTTCADSTVIAERIRVELKKESFSPKAGKDVHMTVSIGAAQFKLQEDMKDFVNRVDQLMYQAKKNGKDRVCSES
jgi:diguanylate cyclase (GGDEF)-like protein/PAS domain S-box-containing protein